MSFLLDTCVLSELNRSVPHDGVLSWVSAQPETALFVSAISLGEIQRGIAKLAEGRRRDSLRVWLESDLRRRFAERILPVSDEVGLAWGNLTAEAERSGRPLPVIDALIAATALVHRAILVTRNVADFRRTGLAIVDPWNEPPTS